MPTISVVDLRHDPPERNCWISPTLKQAISETLTQQEQSLLFLNRRGYAPLTLCRACGHRLECPQCTSWLVEHRFAGQLVCHHCGYVTGKPISCPECNAEGRMAACGPGVERLAEEIGSLFPDARVELMTSDTIRSPRAAAPCPSTRRHQLARGAAPSRCARPCGRPSGRARRGPATTRPSRYCWVRCASR